MVKFLRDFANAFVVLAIAMATIAGFGFCMVSALNALGRGDFLVATLWVIGMAGLPAFVVASLMAVANA